MKLFGSLPSPYVRRIRLLLADHHYEFVNLNIFSDDDRATLVRLNPTRKIPMLLDHEQVIFDSGLIYRYMSNKFGLTPLSWPEENQLILINAANDSLVELLLCQRSGFDIAEDKLFFNLQRERVAEVLAILEQQTQQGLFNDWNYVAMSLYCLADWIAFRQLWSLEPFPALQDFLNANQQQPAVQSSDPRHSA
ncbi:glutathione S-transferase family protein [Alkalimonas collagenimarina]|uniref:Glutathione S-transferase family protein n=1 Tax=Alkalimonas collagenimarina TaxID=400390 RepID=A0ABT9H1M3_9GAMM|nr:glutathione S-transferase family protein [Alkalimonas collagenimarina]MDP4537214.1 glutathione S-transferase family protein [Alkalimonas collagenimarina]